MTKVGIDEYMEASVVYMDVGVKASKFRSKVDESVANERTERSLQIWTMKAYACLCDYFLTISWCWKYPRNRLNLCMEVQERLKNQRPCTP